MSAVMYAAGVPLNGTVGLTRCSSNGSPVGSRQQLHDLVALAEAVVSVSSTSGFCSTS